MRMREIPTPPESWQNQVWKELPFPPGFSGDAVFGAIAFIAIQRGLFSAAEFERWCNLPEIKLRAKIQPFLRYAQDVSPGVSGLDAKPHFSLRDPIGGPGPSPTEQANSALLAIELAQLTLQARGNCDLLDILARMNKVLEKRQTPQDRAAGKGPLPAEFWYENFKTSWDAAHPDDPLRELPHAVPLERRVIGKKPRR